MRLTIERVRGPLTLQDGGRPGQRAFALPSGGFADRRSAALANRLVGNLDAAPLLEIALAAPRLRVDAPCTVAWTGADMGCRVGDAALPAWRRVTLPAGAVVDGGGAREGAFGYLAIGGRWQVEAWRGSVSPLRVGDAALPATSVLAPGRVIVVDASRLPGRACAKPPGHLANAEGGAPALDVWPAPEAAPWWATLRGTFDAEARIRLAHWAVTPRSNRVGWRLRGPSLPDYHAAAHASSTPTLAGTVQLAPDGTLLVNGPDGPTTGGYPRVGRLRAGALDALAQVPARRRVRLWWYGASDL